MTTPKLKPIKEWVLVERDDAESVSPGGILIPDAHKDWARTGTVRGIGEKVREVKLGDRVMFKWSAGFDIRSHDIEYNKFLIMSEKDDILGILEDSARATLEDIQ